MNVSENKYAGLTEKAGSIGSGLDLNFEMTGYIFALYTAYLALSMIIGITGNSILLAIYYKHNPISNVDYYIISIAFFDLVCLLVTVPIYIMMQTKLLYAIDVNALCKALNFTGQIITFAESFLLSALAIERYIKICRSKVSVLLDRRVKYIILAIILSTIVISIPNLFFSWITMNRHCEPIAEPHWIASGFFLLSVSLHIVIFGIVFVCYTSVAWKLFKSLKKNPHNNSIASRKITRRNKIFPLPSQTELRPTGSCTLERRTHETSLPLHTIVKSVQINTSNPPSKRLVTGGAACLEKPSSHGDNIKSEIMEENEKDGIYPIVAGKEAANTEHPSRKHAERLIRAVQIATKVTPHKMLVPESFENMTLAHKRRLLVTTKITFLVTITFIISWFPVWIYTVLVYANEYNDTSGSFFLKQSYLVNTFMNPIVYLACNRNFRNKAKGLFFKTKINN